MGKIHLTSNMTEQETTDEIRSVFSKCVKSGQLLEFSILHQIGGGSKSLTVPQVSTSFTWTPKEVAKAAGKGSVYIWAQKVIQTLCFQTQTRNFQMGMFNCENILFQTNIHINKCLLPRNICHCSLEGIQTHTQEPEVQPVNSWHDDPGPSGIDSGMQPGNSNPGPSGLVSSTHGYRYIHVPLEFYKTFTCCQ